VTAAGAPVIRVSGLTVEFKRDGGWANVLNDVCFEIERGETLGLVGESGSGKTTTAYALFGYRRPGSRIAGGRILVGDHDVLALRGQKLRRIRGNEIALVPQNPAGSLTPSMRIGSQLVEALEAHGIAAGAKAEQRALEALADVGLPDPPAVAGRYPYELSGGQQQRVVIAMAVVCAPQLLVLDEPTTALDVTTQARILRLLARLRAEHEMSMLYVTHNLGVVSQICNRVAVMYAGEIVEIAPTNELFNSPRHPYTRGLIAAVPRLAAPLQRAEALTGLLRREELPPGCRFAPRCRHARQECFDRQQTLEPAGTSHEVACWLWREIAAERRELVGGARS
jgi:oligopeptide/dipeptide ABC transporter ATP-binding protein